MPPSTADPAAAETGGRGTPAEAAEFAARRDFRLLQLLSEDRRAFATARRLGLFSGKSASTARPYL